MTRTQKWLVVTEKPSVAADIAKAVGGFTKKDAYYESDSYYITWASGHLVELLSPEEIDPKYKSWLLKDLPIIPGKFQYKPKDGQKEKLDNIRSLAKKPEVVGFVNACDAGREGELIFREIFDYCAQDKPIKRLWLQSMTMDSIRKEFAHLRAGEDYDALGDAARCRAESDWLIGMNGTRAITKRLKSRNQKHSWSVGRVQTPTLALIVRREYEILKHRAEPFWTVEGRFSTDSHEYSGQWFDPNFKKPSVEDEEDAVAQREKDDRIFSKQKLDAVIKDLEGNKDVAVASETRKESKEIAPQLFDLTMLQREANRRFGMSASRTLQAAQRLYERLKLITYPRTDSKYLPEDYQKTVGDILKSFAGTKNEFQAVSSRLLKNGILNKDRIFNDKMISDHFAIIPTGEIAGELEGDDARVYELILRRFLAAFMPHAVWARVERLTKVKENHFRTRVSDLQEPGWREVYGLEGQEESRLPKLHPSDPNASVKVKSEEFVSEEHTTKPLPRFTEAKLLTLMEHCGRSVDDENIADALKEKGIGTPATRAEIIENLIAREYVMRMGKSLKPTAKSLRLIDALSRIPVDELASVELTGEMERDLKLIEKGKKSRKDFMKRMIAFTTDVVEKSRTFDLDKLFHNEPSLGNCPRCKKGNIVETFWVYKCTAEGCEFIIWKEKNQRYIDRSLVHDVLHQGVIGPVEFYNSGHQPYQAKLTVNENGLLLLDEQGNPLESNAPKEIRVLSEQKLDNTFLEMPGRVIETDVAYLCEFGDPEKLKAEAEAAAAANAEPTADAKPKKGKGKGKKEGEAAATKAKPKKKSAPKRIVARMPKVLCHHNVSIDEFKEYITTGVTPLISDFKSKKGRNFAARLHMKPTGSFEFKFEKRQADPNAEPKPKKASKKAGGKAKVVKKDTAQSKAAKSTSA